jgi:hypothetical protein
LGKTDPGYFWGRFLFYFFLDYDLFYQNDAINLDEIKQVL